MPSWLLTRRLYLASWIWWSFLVMLHLCMWSWIHTWCCIGIDSSWLWISLFHLRTSIISMSRLMVLLLSWCSLSLKNSINSLYEICSFWNSWTLALLLLRLLLTVGNSIKMFWLSSFCHLIMIWMIRVVMDLLLLK